MNGLKVIILFSKFKGNDTSRFIRARARHVYIIIYVAPVHARVAIRATTTTETTTETTLSVFNTDGFVQNLSGKTQYRARVVGRTRAIRRCH